MQNYVKICLQQIKCVTCTRFGVYYYVITSLDLRAYSILSISFLPALQVKDSKVDGACQPRRVNPAVG